MSTDSLKRLPVAFGALLTRHRVEMRLTPEAFARAARLPDAGTVIMMEQGEREPTLTELFAIANALRTPHAFLFLDVIAEWRKDPSDLGLYKSRASDFAKLYRLGYHRDPGDFRELPRAYGTMGEATGAARILSAARRRRGLLPLDTVLIYSRLNYVGFEPDEGEQA